MKFVFEPNSKMVLVRVELTGPMGMHEARFALDTGSSRTCVSVLTLRRMGIDTGGVAKKGIAHGVGR